MKVPSFMLIAGEPSGDLLGAELVEALRREWASRIPLSSDLQPRWVALAPRFFGAGGCSMAAAGTELVCDLTQHAVVGLSDVLRRLWQFRRVFNALLRLAVERQPDAVILVDFSGFNRRFAAALRRRVAARRGLFNNWHPAIIQYVSPQVWASRPGRVRSLERDLDLLLSILPFEKDWYALRAPRLRVEFVGHPICDRHPRPADGDPLARSRPLVVLLPGSRAAELGRHLPVMLRAGRLLQQWRGVELCVVVPNESLAQQARQLAADTPDIQVQIGGLGARLREASVAIAATGTVTLECAWFGVPTVAVYRTSWLTYQVAKRLVHVAFLAMPNLLLGEALYPELIQHQATPENIVRETLELLDNPARRAWVQERLGRVAAALGGPGAGGRAARAVLDLLQSRMGLG